MYGTEDPRMEFLRDLENDFRKARQVEEEDPWQEMERMYYEDKLHDTIEEMTEMRRHYGQAG